MKEMLKSKWMIGFMVVVLSITYVNGSKERSMIENQQKQIESEVVYTEK